MPVWSYTADPSTSTRDAVRVEIGDTDEAHPLLYDEEIDYFLTTEGNTLYAAAAAAAACSGKFARQVDRTMGRTAAMSSQRARAFRTLAADLRRRALSYAVPHAGGIQQQDRIDEMTNTDHVKPAFTRELQEDAGDHVPIVSPIYPTQSG